MKSVGLVGVLSALCLMMTQHASAQVPGIYFIDPGPRAAGMGGCFVAVADDASASAWNPGGLAFLRPKFNLVGMYGNLAPESEGMDYWYAAVAIRAGSRGALASSIAYLGYSPMLFTDPDDPDPSGSFTPNDLGLSLSYGYRFLDALAVGATIKRLRVEFAPEDLVMHGDGSAAAWAYDLGVLYRHRYEMRRSRSELGIGASALHFGSDLRPQGGDEEQTIPLPSRIKAGVSYRIVSSGGVVTLACCETTWPVEHYDSVSIEEEHPTLGYGVELAIPVGGRTSDGRRHVVVAGRLGHVADEDQDLSGLSLGAGFQVVGESLALGVDFASVPRPADLDRSWYLAGTLSAGL